MKKISMFQVDAFTDTLFSGNPAAVCMLDSWIPDHTMQAIAGENNLAETAFVVKNPDSYQIRWFTPTVEVDLCGHATLAAAFVLFECLGCESPEIIFHSNRSGELKVFRRNDLLFLDFPTDELTPSSDRQGVARCIGSEPLEVYRGKTDIIAVVENESIVRNLKPDLKETARLEARGLIVTAKGEEVDFVSRFFAPQSGIDEDPVTGSAHTSLIPLWANKLGKKEMQAKQLSKRGGKIVCIENGVRSLIGGKARLYMSGEINIS
jgi:PhzF family phenazine biosynthesis protein